jgi:hypothetical protein
MVEFISVSFLNKSYKLLFGRKLYKLLVNQRLQF